MEFLVDSAVAVTGKSKHKKIKEDSWLYRMKYHYVVSVSWSPTSNIYRLPSCLCHLVLVKVSNTPHTVFLVLLPFFPWIWPFGSFSGFRLLSCLYLDSLPHCQLPRLPLHVWDFWTAQFWEFPVNQFANETECSTTLLSSLLSLFSVFRNPSLSRFTRKRAEGMS